MHLTIGLTCLVNGGHLLNLLTGLLYNMGSRFICHSLGSGNPPLRNTSTMLSSCTLISALYNKTKCMFEPCKCYYYIRLACTIVCYDRKMHGTNYLKVNFYSKNLVCVNFVEV